MVTNMTEKKMKILRSDNGGEYTSKEFSNYLKEKGIQHQLSIPRTPQQNGVAERMNRTIQETARSMMYNAGQDKKFWAEAVCTAIIIRIRSPTVAVDNMTPYECFYGSKPDVSHFKVFECKAYMHVPKENRKKWDSKTKKCIFVGYSITSKGYRLYDPVSRKICVSRDVLFDEDEFIQRKKEISKFSTQVSLKMKKKYKRSTKLCRKQLKKTMIPLITRKVPVKKRMLYNNNNHDDQRAIENLQIDMV